MEKSSREKKLWIIMGHLLLVSTLFAAHPVINLVVGYKTVYFAGQARQAIAVNDQIPAPILHFKEGDQVTINVYNHLDKKTAIHWHGMLVPWQMDGVEGISQKAIPPGGVFQYQFTLQQSGTYWYHAHAGLQEQQGLYGAFLIDPLQKPAYTYTKDYVVVLSDWSNTKPEQILANLKKSGDYYAPRFPLQPSLVKFIHDYSKASNEERQKLVDDYKMMQKMRMSIYDISDVAYDALVKIQKDNPYIIYAESRDTVGAVYGALTTKPHQRVNYNQVLPFPEPLPVTREMMSFMMGDMRQGSMNHRMPTRHSQHPEMSHHRHPVKNSKVDRDIPMNHSMTMPTEPTIIGDSIAPNQPILGH